VQDFNDTFESAVTDVQTRLRSAWHRPQAAALRGGDPEHDRITQCG
jgi:hypothetical protein